MRDVIFARASICALVISAMALLGVGASTGCTSSIMVKRVEITAPPAPVKGKALLYVYRDRGYFGSAANIEVQVDGKLAGIVGNGTYFFVMLDPGDRLVVGDFGLTKGSAVVQAKKGATYYVEVTVGGSVVQMPAETAKPVIDSLHYAIPEPGA